MYRFHQLFSTKCAAIGMIHVKALPGTPKSCLSVPQLIDYACKEALIYKKNNIDGIILENMFDIPYIMDEKIGPEITAVMTRVCTEVKRIVGNTPCGVQVLAGNNLSATAVALASGLQFVRTESFVFGHVADEGLMQACAGNLLRYARNISANVLYLTDIKKKHCSHAITQDVSLSQTAKAAEFFLSDGVILTGSETGDPPQIIDLKNVKKAICLPVLIGSGVTKENVENFISADALIIGSHFKSGGNWKGDLDFDRIAQFMEKIQQLRSFTQN